MLHYEVLGNGAPVVMIHGFPNNLQTWKGIDSYLSQNFQVILINLPGAGQSPSYQGTLSMSIMAAMVLEVLDDLKIDKAILIGHSMGGYLAMECLSQFPKRIQGMSMVHSLASADTAEQIEKRKQAIALIGRGARGQVSFLRAMAANLFEPAFGQAYPETIGSVVENGMCYSAHDISNLYKAIMTRSDNRSALSAQPIPIQWIIGTSDTATPLALALAQASLSEVSDVHIYNGVGHMSMFENKARLEKDLSEFCHFCIQYY